MIAILLLLMIFSASSFIFAGEAGPDNGFPMRFTSGVEWKMDHEVSFSTNLLLPEMKPNANGVYPVVLDVNVAPELLGIREVEVHAIDRHGRTVVEDERISIFGTRVILDEKLSPSKPGEVWFYRLRFVNQFGMVSDWSEYQPGYGAVTGHTFIKFFEKYAMKPWEFVNEEPEGSVFREKWSESEILEKVDAHSLKSLGDITEHSRFHDGNVHYLSKARGFKGDIFFTYDNFGELDTIWSDGNFNMLGVSLSGNGKRCEGRIEVMGMYPAEIDMSEIRIVEYMPEGDYILSQSGQDTERVPASGNMTFGN